MYPNGTENETKIPLLPVFTVTPPSKPFNKLIKSRIKEEKEDEYSNSVAKIQVCAMFRAGDITQIYKAMYGDAMFVSLSGAQIWRPEGDKNICH